MPSDKPTDIESQQVTVLYRVGPSVAAKLAKIQITRVRDLLFHFPYRYQDRTRIFPLGSLQVGTSAVVAGRIQKVQVRSGYRRSLVVNIEDDTGLLTIRLFHFNNNQMEKLKNGAWLRCFGEVRIGHRCLEMIHPEYSVWQSEPPTDLESTLTPVYPLTEGIGQAFMRSLVQSALKTCNGRIKEWVPPEESSRLQLDPLDAALNRVHKPPKEQTLDKFELHKDEGFQRLIFEELLSHQVARRWLKQKRHKNYAAAMQPDGDLSQRLASSLSFEPTQAQRQVIRETIADMRQSTPMLRLIQGDVGSGKTLVAAAAAAWAVDSGYQVAIMAPTELLAEQHLQTFLEWFTPLEVKVVLLTGRLSANDQRNALADIRKGTAGIVVGTHALFQEAVKFKKLGFIVVDEQHRFGVSQRYALREKGMAGENVPHQLIMTATPIPRSLAMTFYADLDVSSIRELPPGRIPVHTSAVADNERHRVVQQVKETCSAGRQVYWVCPLIDKSDYFEVESAVEKEVEVRNALPDLRVGLLHGRIKSLERDKIMEKFRSGQIDILVATTVIEVGVDVPNANLMIIENAERLGLAQLHQLRGRVGRGTDQANCILLYRKPLSKIAEERLSTLLRTNDGFEIAETDMKLRGAGELLGTKQTGAQLFRIADLPRDMEFVEEVGKTADVIINRYPENIQPLIQRWLPAEGEYGDV